MNAGPNTQGRRCVYEPPLLKSAFFKAPYRASRFGLSLRAISAASSDKKQRQEQEESFHAVSVALTVTTDLMEPSLPQGRVPGALPPLRLSIA